MKTQKENGFKTMLMMNRKGMLLLRAMEYNNSKQTLQATPQTFLKDQEGFLHLHFHHKTQGP